MATSTLTTSTIAILKDLIEKLEKETIGIVSLSVGPEHVDDPYAAPNTRFEVVCYRKKTS